MTADCDSHGLFCSPPLGGSSPIVLSSYEGGLVARLFRLCCEGLENGLLKSINQSINQDAKGGSGTQRVPPSLAFGVVVGPID